jgi:ABC-2 type transport system permease protein
MNRHTYQNTNTPVGYANYASLVCMNFLGETCPELAGRLFQPRPTGMLLVDEIGVDTVLYVKSRVPESVWGNPQPGWSLTRNNTYTALWTRDRPLGPSGGVVHTSDGVAATVRSQTDRSVTVHVDAVPTGGGTLAFSRLAWPGYAVSGPGSVTSAMDGFLLQVAVPSSAAGRDVTVTFTPPGYHLGWVLWGVTRRRPHARGRTRRDGDGAVLPPSRRVVGRRIRSVTVTRSALHDRVGADRPALVPVSPRSARRAVEDLWDGVRARELWAHLGWQDVKARYRRSVIGPFWITISMAVMALGLGVLYSALLAIPIRTLLPSVLVGFIAWNFISGCVLEGAGAFIDNEGLIRHVPSPMSVYAYRTVWRQLLFFAHNLVVYVIMLVIFPQPLGWTSLLAVPALVLLAINGTWMSLLFGIISTRFRDVPPVLGSLMQLAFYVTPIVWQYDVLTRNSSIGDRARIAKLNPFLHYVEILREPLLGQTILWTSWLVVGVLTVVGWAVTFLAYRNYRSRIAYWV